MLYKYQILMMMFAVFSFLMSLKFMVFNKLFVLNNKFSIVMIILIMFVWLFVINSYTKFLYEPKFHYFILMALLFILMALFFSTSSLFLLFILFEASLLTILIMIVSWGYQIERVVASTYLLFYTMFASLPLMVLFILVSNNNFSSLMPCIVIWSRLSTSMIVILVLAFLVKFPVFFVHLWLPKAHVESPTSGSIILAAVLLKMGSYGIYRIFQMWVLMVMNNFLASYVVMIGSVFSVIVCLFQTDIKALIAYSSVSHMTMMFWSMLTMFNIGLKGSLIMMLSHGLISAILFLIAGNIFDLYKTRLIFFIQGLMATMPFFSTCMFLALCMNFSIPPMLSMFSELMIISSLMNFSSLSSLVVGLSIFLSCYYCLMLFSQITFGKEQSDDDEFEIVDPFQYFNMIFFFFIIVSFMFLLINKIC